ncbi:MAG: helix-turn-helix domain-containing protein [Planctomycetota bacterium]|jgi:DNA-binding NarL/FixJ family response regulator
MAKPTSMVRRLTEIERKTLNALFHNPPDPRIHERVNVIRLSSQGYKIAQIASLINRSRSTILRWIRDFNRRGTASLARRGSSVAV